MMDQHADEPYLRVEEIAERFGLPLTVLLRRVEAGDVPSRRIETDAGPRYALRLSDLGIEPEQAATAGQAGAARDAEPEGINAFDGGERPDAAAEPVPESVWDLDDQDEGSGEPDGGHLEEHAILAPAWSTRPLEPRQPPVWITAEPVRDQVPPEQVSHDEPTPAPSMSPAAVAPQADPEGVPAATSPPPAPSETADEQTRTPVVTPQLPARAPAGSLMEPLGQGPRTDLAGMSLDARDLVAGLLDRWERTLEQRIYTEQRQRFQVELSARQNMVRQLQMELQTARAEHAAAQAEKDRVLAAKERELADRERELAETRRHAEEAERGPTPGEAPRRRWFRARGDD